MGLNTKTYAKVALIGALCLILCASLAIGTSQPFRDLGSIPPDAFRSPVDGNEGTQGALAGKAALAASDVQSGPRISRSIDASRLGAPLSTTSIDPATLTSLGISWAAGTVDVLMVADATVDGQVRITEYASGGSARMPRMSVRQDAGRVTIGYDRAEPFGFLLGCAAWGAKHLVVELPQDAMPALEELSLEAASGDHAISDVDAERIALTIASGKTVVGNVRAGALSLDVASGNVSSSGIFDAIDASMASGEVALDCLERCPARTDIDLTSGRMAVTIPEESGFVLDLDKVTGSFACGFPTSQADGRLVHGDGTARLRVSLTTGSFELKPSDR